ncbi:MAG: nitroreductase family deazaflavin-dependent oxidoreductase [Chloroflexi bacterium]|nr:MAG: nitroreductase family deazaflavin-dependent oxidoreductase [Chloroflexota bacterium]
MPDPIEIPPQGTRGAWVPWGGVVMRILKPVMNLQIARYRRTAGRTPPEMMGFPVVLLTTVGARTGHEHTTVLGGFEESDGTWIVVASKSGASSHPHWFFNLAKNPDRVWLEVGNRKIRVVPGLLQGAEREAALAKIAAIAPRYGEYPKKTDREIPVVRLKAA